MRYFLFALILVFIYGCPPIDPNEELIRGFFRAVEQGDSKWFKKHLSKNFKFEVTYLKDSNEYFMRPMEKHNFINRYKTDGHYKINLIDINTQRKNNSTYYTASAVKSQSVMMFIPFESQNWPLNRYELPFIYSFGFGEAETITYVSVDTIQINSEHFYNRWNNFQMAHERINPNINVDSLKNRYDEMSQELYSYLLYGTNGWH